MPRVQASILLPYLLKLGSGLYPKGQPSVDFEVGEPNFLPDVQPRTAISMTTVQPDTENASEQNALNAWQAKQVLGLTNRLIRCYRAIARDSTITELSSAMASPFRFQIVSEGANPPAWVSEFRYPADPLKILPKRLATITNQVRALLAAGNEPEVAALFLLDAERALHDGRFRETVLFCWSTIDATFNRKYDELVDAKLTGEWATGRDFFKGVDFGLKNKMSAALFLVGGRSLFREPGDF
jgi:hypothetical protein